MRYGMVIDLKKCLGCLACTIACKVENHTRPGILWTRVKDEEVGTYPTVTRIFLPVLCMHCQEPPCVKVCPNDASYQREDGIVMVDHDKCVGCKYCMNACPYGALHFNEDANGYFGPQLTANEEIGYERHKVGVVEKCNFCVDRLEQGRKPACVLTCLGKARYLGDLDDPNSEVSQLIESRHGSPLLEELETKPSVYYLPP
jgi:molybdopterin-containing oxidoreductase family iron-sulfur binding subunit